MERWDQNLSRRSVLELGIGTLGLAACGVTPLTAVRKSESLSEADKLNVLSYIYDPRRYPTPLIAEMTNSLRASIGYSRLVGVSDEHGVQLQIKPAVQTIGLNRATLSDISLSLWIEPTEPATRSLVIATVQVNPTVESLIKDLYLKAEAISILATAFGFTVLFKNRGLNLASPLLPQMRELKLTKDDIIRPVGEWSSFLSGSSGQCLRLSTTLSLLRLSQKDRDGNPIIVREEVDAGKRWSVVKIGDLGQKYTNFDQIPGWVEFDKQMALETTFGKVIILN